MATINTRRVWLGGLFGGIVWNIWSYIVHGIILAPRYQAVQESGELLKDPRYPFMVLWILLLFLLSWVAAWAYALVRDQLGAGPWTAVRVGFFLGFCAGFPVNFSLAAWSPLSRYLPLWWMIDLWAGAIFATFVAGWSYQEPETPGE